VDDPRVIYAMNRLIDVCRSRGRWPGTFVPNFERAKRWISAGMKYVAYSVDAGILYKSLRNIRSRLGAS
jgi:2-keto-3-deoxy-L-rhamnonate aldolase RhmA